MTIQQHNAFESVLFILVAPRMAANVGSVARAMKTMGFSNLILVRPPNDGFQPTFNFKLDNPEAVALASGALDVLSNATIMNTLDEALSGVSQSVALTARPREWSGYVVDLPDYTKKMTQYLNNNEDSTAHKIAYVFGNERFGLSNEDVNRCNAICTINVNPDYSSLNLAQAVQIVAYSQRLSFITESNPISFNHSILPRELASEPLATHEHLQGLMNHCLKALEDVNYYVPNQPKRLKERLSSVLNRSHLTHNDVDMLRGILGALSK